MSINITLIIVFRFDMACAIVARLSDPYSPELNWITQRHLLGVGIENHLEATAIRQESTRLASKELANCGPALS